MKIVQIGLPLPNNEERTQIPMSHTLSQSCCICTEPASHSLDFLLTIVGGTKVMLKIPYCDLHFKTGQDYYEKVLNSKTYLLFALGSRLAMGAALAYLAYLILPDIIRGLSDTMLIVIAIIAGFVFSFTIGTAGLILWFERFRNWLARRNQIDIPNSMKDSRAALGIGGVSTQLFKEKIVVRIGCLNDDFAEIVEKEQSTTTSTN